MKNGTFVYVDSRGRAAYLRVRECPNPAVARQMLEDELQQPVRWQEAPRVTHR